MVDSTYNKISAWRIVSSYKLVSDRARIGKIGIWKSADFHFAQSPSEWRKIGRQRYDPKCVNGINSCIKEEAGMNFSDLQQNRCAETSKHAIFDGIADRENFDWFRRMEGNVFP
jgi:hypothetical protein